MKNLKKLSRSSLRSLQGGDGPIINIRCLQNGLVYCERLKGCALKSECDSIIPWVPTKEL